MKVKSTGLGKTQLQCHFDGFNPKEGGEQSVVMVITSTEPVHWHIEADLGGRDLRQMAGQMLKPRIIWHLVKLLVSGSEAKGFVMEKEGGRRSTRERVTREPVVRGLDLSPEAAAIAAVAEAAPALEIGADDSGELTSIPGMRVAQPVAAPAVATAPSDGGAPGNGAGQPSKDSTDLSEREARRAERRKQREEAAKQYATV